MATRTTELEREMPGSCSSEDGAVVGYGDICAARTTSSSLDVAGPGSLGASCSTGPKAEARAPRRCKVRDASSPARARARAHRRSARLPRAGARRCTMQIELRRAAARRRLPAASSCARTSTPTHEHVDARAERGVRATTRSGHERDAVETSASSYPRAARASTRRCGCSPGTATSSRASRSPIRSSATESASAGSGLLGVREPWRRRGLGAALLRRRSARSTHAASGASGSASTRRTPPARSRLYERGGHARRRAARHLASWSS